jgi:hypothetical protein
MITEKTSTQMRRVPKARLWGGPRPGAELDGLTRRPELPPPFP